MVRPVREIEQAAVGCRFHENRLSSTAHFFSSKAVLYNANEDPPGWVVPAYVPFGRIECVAVECRFSRKKTGAQPAYSVTATTIVESRRIIGKGSGAHLPALHCVLSRYAVTCVISVHVYISFKSVSIYIVLVITCCNGCSRFRFSALKVNRDPDRTYRPAAQRSPCAVRRVAENNGLNAAA